MCAWYLRRAGAHVVLIDRQQVARESSWAAAGILSPLYPARYPSPISSLMQQSREEYPRLAQHLYEETGIDTGFALSGLIILDPDLEGRESSANLQSQYELVSAPDLERLEPNLRPHRDISLRLPFVAQVRSPRLLSALRAAVVNAGAQIVEGEEVIHFEKKGEALCGLSTNRRTIPTDRCILATGAWSGDILHKVGLELPIKPVRGQMLLIGAVPNLLRHIVVFDYRYLVPRHDGRVLVGSTTEDVGFDKSATAEARRLLHETAIDLVPTLESYPIEAHWAGLRPGSPDSLPFIGEHPEVDGLFVCAGHYRNGLALAPASARLVVDLVLKEPPSIDPAPFRLDRVVGLSY